MLACGGVVGGDRVFGHCVRVRGAGIADSQLGESYGVMTRTPQCCEGQLKCAGQPKCAAAGVEHVCFDACRVVHWEVREHEHEHAQTQNLCITHRTQRVCVYTTCTLLTCSQDNFRTARCTHNKLCGWLVD